MKLILAIFVSIVILIISATLFSLLGLKLKGESSLINIIIQITPVIIGFSLIRYSWKKITYSEESKDNILDSSQLLVKAVVNHGKEIVQDVKPAINNYIEKHSTDEIIVSNNMDKEENMKCEDINEDEIYDNVMLEIEEDKKIRSTWAKALSLSDGDENKANSLYIKLRVDFLIQEKKNIIENEKKKIEEQELFLKQEKERLDKEKLEEERIKQEKLDFEKKEKLKEEKRIEAERVIARNSEILNKSAKFIKKVFIVLFIGLIIYFSYDQITDKYSVKKQLENGDKYYIAINPDYEKAFKWYEKAALQDNASGQTKLGNMYRLGRGTTQDDNEAFKWYEKAALQEDASSQYWLGYMYRLGLGTTQDYKEAFKWYEKAALQEDASSQYWIALLYKLGYGTKIDYTESFKWSEKSANQGNIHAILLLANNYYFGDGVKQNKMKAKQLYKKACEQGNKDSCQNLKKFNFTN